MRLKLAVIGTFYKKYGESRRAIRAVLDSTRRPDEFWIICEEQADVDNAVAALEGYVLEGVNIVHLPTKKDVDGEYLVIPYSNKINHALDASTADAFVYLDNGSVPHPEKYERMLSVLENNDSYGAVYCAQYRTGYHEEACAADRVVHDAYCVLNFTQVMHRRTKARWTLDMQHARPFDLADAIFWRSLHALIGAFHPVPTKTVMDVHHMPSPAANGL